MSRYQKNPQIVHGMPHYAATGWDVDKQTFFLQVTPHGSDDPTVYLGQTRHEYTNIDIFNETAKLADVFLPVELLDQLRSEQLLSSLRQPGISNASTSIVKVGDQFHGWTCIACESVEELPATAAFIQTVADMAHNEPFYDTLDGETQELVYGLGREDIAYDQVRIRGFMLLTQAIAKFKVFKRLAGQPARKPICDECGSDEVMCDALASWNAETQSFELDNNFDTWQCFDEHTCDSNETKVEWIDANVTVSRSVECNGCGAKSDDIELSGNVCNVCKRGMMAVRYEFI